MIKTGFEDKVKIQEIVSNQVPEFIKEENPKFVDFLKQYYVSQEYQGGTVNIIENIDEYLRLDNLTPDVINGSTFLTQNVSVSDTTIYVTDTKGFPNSYGLIEIDDEIITYKERTQNSFVGCIRGFSGIREYNREVVFKDTESSSHSSGSKVTNLSVLFLQEFYSKIKGLILPELRTTSLVNNLNVNNFLKNSRSLYQSKGTKESFRILFNALFGIKPKIVDLENFLIKPSDAQYIRRKELLFENLTPDKDPTLLIGQQIVKDNDPFTFGSISEIEIFSRQNKIYYKFLIFLGYDESNIENSGEFKPTTSSRTIQNVFAADQIDTLTLDSTINFEKSGYVYYNDVKIFYTNKSLNQLFGCFTEGKDYIDIDIPKKSNIISIDTYYGYESGIVDESNKVTLRLLNVVSNLSELNIRETGSYTFTAGESILVKDIGYDIKNEFERNTRIQILANSLTYNTSSRYEINRFFRNSNYCTVLSEIDPTSLKVGDRVEFLERNTEIVVPSLNDVLVTLIDNENSEIRFDSILTDLNNLKKYDIRRKIKIASSSIVPLKYKNITSDVSNTYIEGEENLYIASNSLPSYEVDVNIFSYEPSELINYDNIELKYTTLLFDSELSIITGDRVYYDYTENPIEGLTRGFYYIKLSEDYKEVKLYLSRSFINVDKFIYLGSSESNTIPSGKHTFTLVSQKTEDGAIHPQKVFKKIIPNPSVYDGSFDIGTTPVGILVNGVEILSYKSKDKVYYGPLKSVNVINKGENYDVINPPKIELSYGSAKIQPILKGDVKKILIDPQNFGLEQPIKVEVHGGNGKNVSLSPIIKTKSRQVFFDARIIEEGGGLSITSETITFLTDHNFYDGQKIIYDINNINNEKIGLGVYQGSNLSQNKYLGNNTPFYAEVINSKTVRIYGSFEDYKSGINTVGFTTVGNFGIHKFKTEPVKVLDSVKIINGGSGFTNRKLIVNPSGISTYFDTIFFKDHGFSTGELITYDYEVSPITGLSTSVYYYVLKQNNDYFRLCNAGIGGTDNQYYLREKYVSFEGNVEGYQYFSYPPITVSVKYLPSGNEIQQIKATPIVKGIIEDVYIYERGENYGSQVVNLENPPGIKILSGNFAQLTPIINDGRIVDVIISYGGADYYSVPDIIIDSKSGVGAELRCDIFNGKISNVVVLNSGFNYNYDDTSIRVVSSGKNASFEVKIRDLTLNNSYKYGIQKATYRDPSSELLYKTKDDNLQYAIIGYSNNLINNFEENPNNHSKIIGWSYDGHPIYGPYGYSDPLNSNSQIKLLKSGYTLQPVENRPNNSLFNTGYFIEDYKFTYSGDLDKHNGRFCRTPEYPEGVYAYFATAEVNVDNEIIGSFPYFIGNTYKSKVIEENKLLDFNQNSNLSTLKLQRNTYPYKLKDSYAKYDFFDYSLNSVGKISNVNIGKADSLRIIEKGNNYKVNDLLSFSSQNEFGYGLKGFVSWIEGLPIDSIESQSKTYENVKFYSNGLNEFYLKYLPNFDIPENSIVRISGLTTSFSSLNKFHEIYFQNFNTKLLTEIPFGSTGIITDIQLENFPPRVSIGSSIKISGLLYDQYFSILNYFKDKNIIKVKRTSFAGLSTENSLVTILSDVVVGKGSLSQQTNIENYPRYFNPRLSIGIGTFSGTFDQKTFYIGQQLQNVLVPSQSIYLPDHNLKTNQKVKLKRPSTAAAILVSEDVDSAPFNLLGPGKIEEDVYVIAKTKDLIGIVTSTDRISTSSGLYFPNLENAGSDNYEYSIETIFSEELCTVDSLISTVSISTYHNLNNSDVVDIKLVSNNSLTGITTDLKIKYLDDIKSIVNKTISFYPEQVNSQESKLTLVNHGLDNGDLVYYISTSVISGLSTNFYYVHKIDSNNIRLSETYKDSVSNPPIFLKFNSTGIGTQEINLVHSKIKIIKNDSLKFDLSDPSLNGYKLKIYYDSDFNNEFLNIEKNENVFSLSGFGTPGISTNANAILKYNTNFPSELYYSLENNSTKDIVKQSNIGNNLSKIYFVDSIYSGKYEIFNVEETKFSIYLKDDPEKDLYSKDSCDVLTYTTSSTNASGPVAKISIIDPGYDYNELPYYSGSSSKTGVGLNVIPSSNSIGKYSSIDLNDNIFEYPTDTTLIPSIYAAFKSEIKDSKILSKVSVLSGGRNYPSAPDLVVINSETKEEIETGLIQAVMSGTTGTSNIEKVSILVPYTGLPNTPVEIKAINNSNGIIIDRITSSLSGIITCLLKTPILGFVVDPFTVGDEVFVENIENVEDSGIGFNSVNHGYEFFKVIGYDTLSNPGKVVIQIPKLYGNPGVAVTFQTNTIPSITKKVNYPVFEVEQEFSIFIENENVSVLRDNVVYETDIIISKSVNNYIKYFGNFRLNVDDILIGNSTGYRAKIVNVSSFDSSFLVSGSKDKSYGWKKETGKLSNDLQVTPNNDYYQNLSYTIKSNKTWDEVSPYVNSIVHPIGTKNFVDTEIDSVGIITTKLAKNSYLEIIRTYLSQSRVDVIKNFDLVNDFDVFNNRSNFIKFKNIKLIDYFESRSNRVLQVDDISPEFSSSDDDTRSLKQIITVLSPKQLCTKFLVQTKSTSLSLKNEIQFTEIIALKKRDKVYYLEKNSISNKGFKFVDINPIIDLVGNYYLELTPDDPYNTDYEVKILSSQFSTIFPIDSALRIGTSDIINSVHDVSDTETILSLNATEYSGFYSEIHIVNKKTSDTEYVEMYAVHDGQNVYYSDYNFNSLSDDFSYGFIGSFGLSISNDIVNLTCTNNIDDSNIAVSLKTIAFNSTSGIGTYRYKSTRQADGSERTALYESDTITVSSASTIASYDSELFSSFKSIVNVSVGNTFSLHQLTVMHDLDSSYHVEYPMILVGDNLGIGTFGSSLTPQGIDINFYPNNQYEGSNITIKYFNTVFYTFLDEINKPLPLSVDPLFENLNISKYYGLNSKFVNRLNFNLKYRDISIFAKTFDPFDDTVLNPETGIFTIDNHFFSTGEKLFYKPKSTFIGLGQSAMGIVNSIDDNGISTNKLPSTVYAIKLDNARFKVATNKSNALSGIGAVITDLGEGNAHMFEMEKKNEKSIITINNLIQYPITYSGIEHSLSGNNGQIGIGNTFFTLSGISSVKPNDLIKINDEYMKVLNVGIGTSSSGPILFFTGDKNIVEVERGFVGSSATSHLDGSTVRVYRGSYNISEDQIYFTNPPRGNVFDLVTFDERNLPRARASFSGRVFLRKDYTTNTIFDDISPQFTGVGQTFTIKTQGINTVGLGTTSGNGIVLINGIYQTPLTENITNYNFQILENANLGISSIVFSGIKDDLDNIKISESDINKNQLPRGGIIVSLGSTAGLGYAPLVGCKVGIITNSSGGISTILGVATTGKTVAFTTAIYNNNTGVLDVFSQELNNLRGVNQVKLVGLAFTCPSGSGIVSYFPSHNSPLDIIGISTNSFSIQVGTSTLPHSYIGFGTVYTWYEDLTFGSGYRNPVSIAITETGSVGSGASIRAIAGDGGSLSFIIDNPGSGYENPSIKIPSPDYENLPVIGVSRLGIGQTTDTGIGALLNVEVGPSANNVGIGTTLFEVSSFKITRPGYNFKRGDIFKPVGLVTAKGLNSPIEEFELVVLETYNDNFASWQFGELNLIDSIRRFQNGSRLNYPLYYNGELISFQKSTDNNDSQVIDFDSLLVIFINGILQEPKYAYEFNGGSSVRFTTPPKVEDNVEIYFYVGTRGEDSVRVDVNETIKIGDTVQIYSNNGNLRNTITQNTRTVFDFPAADLMETNIYSDQGIDDLNLKPIFWIKQKEDIIINDFVYSKVRDSIEPQVYPTAKIIGNFTNSDTEIFVDDSSLFNYEDTLPIENIDLVIVPPVESVASGLVTAIVSQTGEIDSLDIQNPGIGYTNFNVNIKISNPYYGIGVGVGSTAVVTINSSNGLLTNPVIVSPGFGYTYTHPPQVIVSSPEFVVETVTNAPVVEGFNGVIVGIATTSGIGTDLAIEFEIETNNKLYSGLEVDYPIYIFNTKVGNGVTSIISNENEIIGISTYYLDNVYKINQIVNLNNVTRVITCNVSSQTDVIGIGTTGTFKKPLGNFSWGKISGFTRSSNRVSIGISGFSPSSGLSTYPTIQRRGYGLRNTGSLRKSLIL